MDCLHTKIIRIKNFCASLDCFFAFKMSLAITYDPSKSGEFILDALPYIDDAEYDDTHRKFAMQMIEEEQKVYPKTKNYLKQFPKPDYEKFLTPRLREEFERMKEKKVGRFILFSPYCFRIWKNWI